LLCALNSAIASERGYSKPNPPIESAERSELLIAQHREAVLAGLSATSATWMTNIADGSFANIQNNPSLQEVSFAPVNARCFRFTSLQAIWGSGWTSAAEISVLPAAGKGD
jgi:hypothetical protein